MKDAFAWINAHEESFIDQQEKRERAIEKAQEEYFRKEEKNARLARKERRTD